MTEPKRSLDLSETAPVGFYKSETQRRSTSLLGHVLPEALTYGSPSVYADRAIVEMGEAE